MLKTRSIVIFIALFTFIFTYLHATPFLVLLLVAELSDLNHMFVFTTVINRGIDENAPEHYFIDIDGFKASFAQLGIPIHPPKAGPWSIISSGNVDLTIGLKITISKDNKELDSTYVI
ncbi:hypothetical protein F8M41_017280 [Gigaspora margarita]|uniref:Uncharacterized protein n=1 Tax=Gigaspora margarita TaxID=4874 RepID=A0A8H4EM80_GIGMA|nr:hypothetical protein F8M41_017280 [Gigaspora margarita]